MAAEGKGYTPMCRRPSQVCPIEDLASDFALNQYIQKFIEARNLYELNGVDCLLRDAYEELGLLQDRDLLLSLELSFRLGMNKKSKEQEKENKWNKQIR